MSAIPDTLPGTINTRYTASSTFAMEEAAPTGLPGTGEAAGQLPAAPSRQSGSAAGDGVKDANGAPALAQPTTTFSPDDMVALLQHLYAASEQSQLETHKNNVVDAGSKARKANEQQQQKIQEWIRQCEKAAKASSVGKIFGLIGKIAAVLAAGTALAVALGLTPFSAGATAPLAVLAGIGLAAATMSLIDHSVKMAGGPEVSLSNGFTKLTGLILAKCGIPGEQAEKISRVVAGAVGASLILPVLMEPQLLSTMAAGICQLSGAGDITTNWVAMGVGVASAIGVGAIMFFASGGTSSPSIVKAALNATSSGVQAVTQAGEGSAGIASAVYQRRADNKMADKKELDALLVKLNQAMEEGREDIKKLIEQIQDGVLIVSRMIQGNADNMRQIISHQSRQAA